MNFRLRRWFAAFALCGAANVAPCIVRASSAEERDPCARHEPLRLPFFGDTHVHTTYSFDAWGQGTLAGPDEAYRYAKGESLGTQPHDEDGHAQAHVRLRRPLDFAVVTDHSDLLGETEICRTPELKGHDSLICRVVRRYPALGYALVNGHTYAMANPRRYSFCGEQGMRCIEASNGPWQATQEAAEVHYDRSPACGFTTFVGYEWTGMPNGQNIHRNVIFANDVVQDLPTTYIETPTAEGLWNALERECTLGKPGCDAIAIPHNSNVSNGLMWTTTRGDGSPITADDARRRARLETLVEVTQHKGDSECRAGAEDELCSYEKLAYPRLQEMETPALAGPLPPLIYAREALGQGLLEEQRLGVNPFRFGLIGSTDTHLATPGMVDEDEFIGHAAGTANARFGVRPFPDRAEFNPGGLAVLWAEENSRPALFAAMKRREAYGTSGPRIVARFFGGWEFPRNLCDEPDLVARSYAGGVPMGGELEAPPVGGMPVPSFLVSALRDPGDGGVPSTALQRIQIIKGWAKGGRVQERVYEVAGDAASRADVDLSSCTPRGEGFAKLCSVWRDPDFDPASPAFYYMRVLENPSCRWNSWSCLRAGVDCRAGRIPDGMEACCDASIPRTIQERAWTSPIWYVPAP